MNLRVFRDRLFIFEWIAAGHSVTGFALRLLAVSITSASACVASYIFLRVVVLSHPAPTLAKVCALLLVLGPLIALWLAVTITCRARWPTLYQERFFHAGIVQLFLSALCLFLMLLYPQIQFGREIAISLAKIPAGFGILCLLTALWRTRQSQLAA